MHGLQWGKAELLLRKYTVPALDLTRVIYSRDLSLSKPNPFPSHISLGGLQKLFQIYYMDEQFIRRGKHRRGQLQESLF